MTRRLALVTAAVCLLVAAAMARAADPSVVPSAVDPAVADPPFQGWGTSLAWWAKVAGGYREPARSRIMDGVFDARTGLGLTVVRYNVGGGENPAGHTLQFRAAVPGFEPAPGRWDWSADAGQRWVLQAALRRGADHVQAFSNSPPYWMTRSGSVAGGDGGAENLKPDAFPAFADYLATVAQHYHDAWGVTFETLDPLNEPASHWWRRGGWQEGCRFDRPAQDRIVRLTGQALRDHGLATTVAAPDENSIDDAAESFLTLSDPARAFVSLVTTHSYAGDRRAAVAELARAYGKGLWMSEYGDDDPTGLQMAGRIVADLRGLHPAAWVAWQVADDSRGWGLFRSPLRDEQDDRWHVNGKYYVMAQFSRYVRPGARLVAVADPQAVAALDARARTLTVVAVNAADVPAERSYDLSRLTTVSSPAAAWRTSPAERLAPLAPVPVRAAVLTVTLPPRSVTTLVVPDATYAGPPAAVDPNAAYQLRNDAGGLLGIATDARSPGAAVTARPTNDLTAAHWGFLPDGRGRYAVYNRSDGLALDVADESHAAGGRVIQWPDHNGPGQRWALDPTPGDAVKLRNSASGLVLDGSAPAGVVQSPAADTSGQRWHLVRAAPPR